MELIHGGDIHGYRLRHGHRPLDFSASLSPLGMPAAVRDAIRDHADASYAYPDPLCRELTAAVAGHRNVREEWLQFGNGAADSIHRLAQALRPRNALLIAPGFAEYERALRSVGCDIAFHTLRRESGFVLENDIFVRLTRGIDILFLCQPNNPTAGLTEPKLVASLLDRCRETETILVADECFLHFIENSAEHSLIRRVRDNKHLFILDSFTKLYGMAGVRLGYGVSSNQTLMTAIANAGPPWSVSTIAQAAGIAALRANDHTTETLRLLASAKPFLVEGLQNLGHTVYGSAANFVFFHARDPELAIKLEAQGILIRDCGNFPGLEPGFFRVAIRRENENRALLRAMADTSGKTLSWPRQ